MLSDFPDGPCMGAAISTCTNFGFRIGILGSRRGLILACILRNVGTTIRYGEVLYTVRTVHGTYLATSDVKPCAVCSKRGDTTRTCGTKTVQGLGGHCSQRYCECAAVATLAERKHRKGTLLASLSRFPKPRILFPSAFEKLTLRTVSDPHCCPARWIRCFEPDMPFLSPVQSSIARDINLAPTSGNMCGDTDECPMICDRRDKALW